CARHRYYAMDYW
nr:immunoglobulin heavy chain junction region [Mus musculus]